MITAAIEEKKSWKIPNTRELRKKEDDLTLMVERKFYFNEKKVLTKIHWSKCKNGVSKLTKSE